MKSLRYNLALFFLVWAMAMPGLANKKPRKGDCVPELIAKLQSRKAPVVQKAPFFRARLAVLMDQLRGFQELETPPSFEQLSQFVAELEKLELKIRTTHWKPAGVPEDYVTVEHKLAEEASHDLKNALQAAVGKSIQLLPDMTTGEFKLLMEDLTAGMSLAMDILAAVEDPSKSPMRLISIREIFHLVKKVVPVPESFQLIFVEPHSGLTIEANRSDILRIIQNLVGNAVQAMPGGGEIRISAETHEPTGLEAQLVPGQTVAPSLVKLQVKDNGPGIPPERIADIFAEEAQMTTKAAEGVNSRGIGIRSVMALADRNHKGTIDIESKVASRTAGGGTTVSVLFPQVKKVRDTSVEQEISVRLEPGSVLFLDDDSFNRVIATRMMSKYGPVATYTTFDALSEAVREQLGKVRAICLDQTLPGGALVSENIAALRSLGFQGVILVVSAKDLEGGAEVDGFVAKPVNWPKLPVLIEELETARKKRAIP